MRPLPPRVNSSDPAFIRHLKLSLRWIYDQLDRQRVYGDRSTFWVQEGPDGTVGHAIIPGWSGEAWMNGQHWYASSFVGADNEYGQEITNESDSNAYLEVDYTGGSYSLEIVDEITLIGSDTCPDGKKYYNLQNVMGDIHFDMP